MAETVRAGLLKSDSSSDGFWGRWLKILGQRSFADLVHPGYKPGEKVPGSARTLAREPEMRR
jgi:hypothetical protein